jgi:glucosamine kinase
MQLVQAVSTYTPDAFGKLAPIAVEAMDNGCDISHGLIAEGAAYLTSLTKSLFASTNTTLPLCIVGGMAPVYLPFIEQNLKEQLVRPKFDAQHGAIFFSNDERQLLCSASQ